mmetsp:Transcript_48590/g.128492  ORF Transcript_48590/g.128492 Transcript_48590/m.128492 type:complete len:272 (+) Transcript_48590:77-892(+)
MHKQADWDAADRAAAHQSSGSFVNNASAQAQGVTISNQPLAEFAHRQGIPAYAVEQIEHQDYFVSSERNTAEIIIDGTLEKRGYWNTAWKSRYFILNNRGELAYYKSKLDAEAGRPPISTIAVALPGGTTDEVGRAIETLVHVPVDGDADDRFVIELDVLNARDALFRPTSRTYILAAPSALCRARWLAALVNAARAWRHTGDFQPKLIAWSRAAPAPAASSRDAYDIARDPSADGVSRRASSLASGRDGPMAATSLSASSSFCAATRKAS